MGGVVSRRLFGPLLVLLAAVLAAAVMSAPKADAARSASGIDTVAGALKERPVYVDPRAAGQVSNADVRALSGRIEQAGKPVFLAVLPESSDFPSATVLQDLRSKVGTSGVYGVVLGDRFAAGADGSVLARNAVDKLSADAKRSADGSTKALLDRFADGAVQQAGGQAPDTWAGSGGNGSGSGSAGSSGPVLAVLLGVLVLTAGGSMLVRSRGLKRQAEQERQQLETLRPVVDEDITAFGEELDRIGFEPTAASSDEAMRQDYTEALDSYDEAKRIMTAARRPGDVRSVTEELAEGRFALATLEARREGTPLPERSTPCFFDPRHGPSVADVSWAPPGGTERTVPVCAADATRLADGAEPMTRTVDSPNGRRPYWEAGSAYAPWAGGYFGGGMLPGLLMGTMLGNMLHAPAAYGADFGGGDGGDFSGSDFAAGDFGGGDFGGGGFGGFGQGGGDFGGF